MQIQNGQSNSKLLKTLSLWNSDSPFSCFYLATSVALEELSILKPHSQLPFFLLRSILDCLEA